MNEWPILLVCGLILIFAIFLVAQDFFHFYWIKILLVHPWDYIVHFVVSFCGVLFFFGLFQNIFSWGHILSLVLAVLIMIAAGFFKEIILDPMMSMTDVAGNLLGALLAFVILI